MTMSPEERDALVQSIAKTLGENDDKPIKQIQQIIDLVSPEFAQSKLQEALKIEEEGGLMVHKGSRRRTLGGIYFYIIKGELTPEVRQQIFPNFGKTELQRILQWDERIKELATFMKEDGIAGRLLRNPRILLQGRPGTIKQIENTMVITMEHDHTSAPYPKGVPTIPDETHMRYIMYVGHRQWQKIEIAIKDEADFFIAEGYQVWDAELGAMAVFVHHLSTRELDRVARRKKALEEAEKSADDDTTPEKPDQKQTDKNTKTDPKAKNPPKNKGKNAGNKLPANDKTPEKPAKADAPRKATPVLPAIDIPDGMTNDDITKLHQLHNAAQTFRERIAVMETKGQAGVDMTKRLLLNTEKQLAELMQKYSS